MQCSEIDWTECELGKRVPGKVSGRPIVRGTRILPDAIINSFDMGENIEGFVRGFPFAFAGLNPTID